MLPTAAPPGGDDGRNLLGGGGRGGSGAAMLFDDDAEAEDREFLRGFDRIDQRLARRGARERRVTYAKAGAIIVAAVIGIALIAALGVGAKKVAAAPYTCRTEPGATYEFTFFVIGDWGRLGNGPQRTAARMMADVAKCMRPDAVLSTGDNFYDHGLTGLDDPQFKQSWADVYADLGKDVPWYLALGNHDYNDGISPTANAACAARVLSACPAGCCYSAVWQAKLNARDARWHSSNGSWAVPGLPQGLVEIFVVDTSPHVARYLAEPWAANAGGLHEQNATAGRAQLQALLSGGGAAASPLSAPPVWRFVAGHHPVASYGGHCRYAGGGANAGDCADMAWLKPVLEAGGVAAYFSGHDHDLQVISARGVGGGASGGGGAASGGDGDLSAPLYVVSGGGSDVRPGEAAKARPNPDWPLRFFADDQGFAAVRLNRTHAVVDVYASNKLAPSATYTLAARGAAGVGGSGSAAAAAAADKGRASFGHGRRRRKD